MTMVIIGRLEKVDLPDLELYGLDAKIDTGADSSALHCADIKRSGKFVSFRLCDSIHPSYNGRSFILPISKRIKVKSSNGTEQKRYCIRTTICLGGISRSVLVSITDRKDLRYPMLVGKSFLSGEFLVDVSMAFGTNIEECVW